MHLLYEKGLSKYSLVVALFPEDSYTHRMKRLQRAARKGVWTKHFAIMKVHVGGYTVSRLIPDMTDIVWNTNGTATVHIDTVQHAYTDLLFDHEVQERKHIQLQPWKKVWRRTVATLEKWVSFLKF